MTALTDTQLAYLHSEVGAGYDEDDLQDRYDRLGDVTAVAAQVVRERLAALESSASSYTIPGVISESFDATIRALSARSARLEAALTVTESAAVASVSRVTRSDRLR